VRDVGDRRVELGPQVLGQLVVEGQVEQAAVADVLA